MELVLNMFGADRPGLVAKLTGILYNENANLGDADMTRIGGTFAFILAFSLPEERLKQLRKRLNDLASSRSLKINMTPAEDFESEWGTVRANTIISVYGADRPGIVYRVSDTLADEDINICDLHSSLDETEELYIMTLEVRRPEGMTVDDLREALTQAEDELNVDVSVRELAEHRL